MKKRRFAITLSGFLLIASVFISSCAVCPPCKEMPTEVYFSRHGGATRAIINEIINAKTEILVQAYSFTSTPIAKALVDAHKRSVKVEAILDKSQRKESYTEATFLAKMGVPTFIDDKHAIAHNKVMIIPFRSTRIYFSLQGKASFSAVNTRILASKCSCSG